MLSYKQIPGNAQYVISLSRDIRGRDGRTVNFPVVEGKVRVELFGSLREVDLEWLSLIAHFEIALPDATADALMNVRFRSAHLKLTRPVSGKIAVFRKPVVLSFEGKNYRVIPSFCRYAVSREGDVLDIANQVNIHVADKLRRHNSVEQYPAVFIYDPERLSYRYIYLHRLVALAWHENKDYEYRPVVNHKDGNKKNFHASNLEWVTFQENSAHAVAYGLRPDVIACRVRDQKSGIVRDFASLTQAAQFMGLKRAFTETNFFDVKGRLISNRYEIKLKNDDSPWYYEGKDSPVKLGRYVITVTAPDRSVEQFFDTRDFKKRFRLWNNSKLADLLRCAKQRHPGYGFEYHDYYHSQHIEAYNVDTHEVLCTKTITKMSSLTGVTEDIIRVDVRFGENRVRTGNGSYVFRFKADIPWQTEQFVRYAKPKTSLVAYNHGTKELLRFDSLRQAARILKADRSSVANSLINKIRLGDWSLAESENDLRLEMPLSAEMLIEELP